MTSKPNRKTRRAMERANPGAVPQLTEEQARIQALGLVYDRAINARQLAVAALEWAEGDEQRQFFTDAIDDLEEILVESSEALLKPILGHLRRERSPLILPDQQQ